MSKNSAEYMRAYRARKKAEHATPSKDPWIRIEELEEEVRHLKAELAKRKGPPHPMKTSQSAIDKAEQFLLEQAEPGELAYTRKAQQAQRDAILRKINRGG